jgi:drug/metabolite transporter (DMT)-like permease
MHLLVSATLIWAFSFSLIGQYLAGSVDPFFSAWIRTALALAVFLPLLFRQRQRWREGVIPAGIGGIQLGLMYAFYYQGFEFLTVPEVLIFTIITPLYVTLIDDCFERRFSWFYLVTASLAVAGPL